MFSGDVDAELEKLAGDREFAHRDAARAAVRFRAGNDVADLVAVTDDPHPCAMTDVVFAMASAKRPWLNWVPMPSEAISNIANEVGGRRAQGEELAITGLALSSAEPASAMTAAARIVGRVDVTDFPAPDIRVPLRRGRHTVWRYDGLDPVPAVAAPSAEAVHVLYEAGSEPWPSMLSGWVQAEPLGKLPLSDLLGLLAHLPGPPGTARWDYLARSTPMYWYRLLQPWVCLGILRHADGEPWATSTRREVLTDLALGIEDWVADAALFALVTAAYREPELRTEVRTLVRTRLDAAVAARRVVTIEESLANLLLVTPGRTADDRALAQAVLTAHAADDEPVPTEPKRRWWHRKS